MIFFVQVSRSYVGNLSYVPFFVIVLLLLVLAFGFEEFIWEVCNWSCVVSVNICISDVQ